MNIKGFFQVDATKTGARVEQGIPHQGDAPIPPRPMETLIQPTWQPSAYAPAQRIAPGAAIQQRPWQFVGLMLAAGFLVGILLRFKTLRKAIRLYAAVRRW
jgi:hypothetical protein